jgi:DNA-binding CsgD family transcriptional regulator
MFVGRYRLIYGFAFLSPFVRYLLYSSLLMLVLLSTYYAAANFPQRESASATARIAWSLSNNFIGLLAFSGLLVSFLQVLRGFEGKPLAPWEKWSLRTLIACACFSYAIGSGLAASGRTAAWLKASRDLYNLAVPVLLSVALAHLLIRADRRAFVVPRRSVRAFLLLYLVAFALVLILPVVLAGSGVLVLAILLPATHLLPFLWVSRFLLREPGLAPIAIMAAIPLDTLAMRHGLTEREREIVEHLLSGNSNAEIAEALFISVGTVKNHVYNVYRKLGVRTRGQLYRYARESSESMPPST